VARRWLQNDWRDIWRKHKFFGVSPIKKENKFVFGVRRYHTPNNLVGKPTKSFQTVAQQKTHIYAYFHF
jgi:hypothetical protein